MRARVGGLTLLFIVLGFGLVGVRLLYMQVLHNDYYRQQATELQTNDIFVSPQPRHDLRRQHAGAGGIGDGRAHLRHAERGHQRQQGG